MTKIDPRVREQAIDALLICGNYSEQKLSDFCREELCDSAWQLVMDARGIVAWATSGFSYCANLEAAQLLIEGWCPGDEVVALQPR